MYVCLGQERELARPNPGRSVQFVCDGCYRVFVYSHSFCTFAVNKVKSSQKIAPAPVGKEASKEGKKAKGERERERERERKKKRNTHLASLPSERSLCSWRVVLWAELNIAE